MNLTPAQKEIFREIREKATKNYVTPTISQLAWMTGYSESCVGRTLAELRENGLLICEYKQGGAIKIMGAMTRRGRRWTKESVPRGRHKSSAVAAFGGGPIAKMRDRDKAEKQIAEIFDGRKFENMKFKQYNSGGRFA